MFELPDEIKKLIKFCTEIDQKIDAEPVYGDVKELVLPNYVSIVESYGESPCIKLPPPMRELIKKDLYETIISRRSCRNFAPKPLPVGVVSTLLYLSMGCTGWLIGGYSLRRYPLRSTPTSGGLNGIDLYLINRFNGDALPNGFFYYDFVNHELKVLYKGDPTVTILKLFRDQSFVESAPLWILLILNLVRGVWKYKTEYYRLGLLDAGVLMEQIHLVATAMDLCSCLIGGLDKKAARVALGLEYWKIPVGAVAVGYKE
ncbi:MAG: SagB/ThcOx family dehydrogenase [Crenarchaeota archaeon]|nr:SagB/ThcOx family dehydrogenase [Thermoproteota archaeon]MCR8454460.1 SagB/ThcOx family dehydrogenase [Thermoproteota archaeon]MCR8463518.1 SagB/ThcOx family dehydrogenase [Thermoproteota archaeon]MCR8471198.1 SagB/ThcOx family dehydrogenase [Thermoproteota archaeon]MCR8471992.1 SagB/ThcOx family dehydrogenase [Thermoproteota archaeon]